MAQSAMVAELAQRSGSTPESLWLRPRATAAGAAPAPAPAQQLTRAQAEQMALKNNPRISVSQLLALAQHQVVREARSAELPTANGAITADEGERCKPYLRRIAHRLAPL